LWNVRKCGCRCNGCINRRDVLITRTLEVTDLVFRRILSREGLHNLSPMWEGPFKVTHIARPGSARLETAEGVPVGNPWNIAHLRKFYP
jgi:hypothetical protein